MGLVTRGIAALFLGALLGAGAVTAQETGQARKGFWIGLGFAAMGDQKQGSTILGRDMTHVILDSGVGITIH